MKHLSRVQSPESRACGLAGTARCAVRAAFSGASVPPAAARRDVPANGRFMESKLPGGGWRVTRTGSRAVYPVTRHVSPATAFTLVEMLVTMVLLTLIVLALMAVFTSTQNAFRSSLTQSDILESGRNAMNLIVGDLQQMTPSFGTNILNGQEVGVPGPIEYFRVVAPVNFYVDVNSYNANYQPLVQSLPGTVAQRTNLLENFFILSRQSVNGGPSWVATGYVVDPLSSPTNALYRFSMTSNIISGGPLAMFRTFAGAVETRTVLYNPFANTTNWSHLMDGVVGLTVRAYDPDGFLMPNTADFYGGQFITNQNTYFFPVNNPPYLPLTSKVVGFYMFSNTVPASVEVEMSVLEDAVLQRAEGLGGAGQTNYLAQHAGQVHVFRQRVWIRNLDPSAYQ
ncbi:MAG: hypothetical protein WBN22_10960 [Verrucomicrobiia bacterium]